MLSHGYLFGKHKLLKDPIRNEVFIEKNNIFIIMNNQLLHSYTELKTIADELNGR